MRPILAAVFLVCALFAGTLHADPILARAADLERSGDLDGAASVLGAWLAANPGAAGSPQVFDSYLRVEQDFARLLQTATAFLQQARGVPGAGTRFERIARLLELSGRIEQARDAYLAAHAEGAQDSALVSAFLLSVQMNDLQSMAAALDSLKGSGGSTEILLRALSDLRAGNRAAARSALTGLADQTGNPDLALKSLWVLYQSALASGDPGGQSDARAKLLKRFSGAPETALAAGGGAQGERRVVLPAPVPDPLGSTGTAAPAAAPTAAAAAPADTQPAAPGGAPPVPAQPLPSSPAASAPASPAVPAAPRFSVQAGSFQMKENADDLVAELARRGFSTTVLHDVSQGKDRWRVFAGSGLEREAAEAVRGRLSAAGYTGFLIRDE